MPIFLKKIKRVLAQDANRVGKTPAGEFIHTPPTLISRDVGDYARLRVSRLDRTIQTGLRAIDFTGLVRSETEPLSYRVTIRFHDVLMSGRETEVISVPVRIVAGVNTGRVVYYKVPTIAVNPVKLRCSCPDFRHRFSHELDAHDGLIGEPLPYTRETAPWEQGGRPYANATEKIGMCKHVYSLIIHLKARGFIRER